MGELRNVIDGGVADNIPWMPLVVDYPCDELVIVGCNPISDWNDSERIEERMAYERVRRVIAADVRLRLLDRNANSNPIINSPPKVISLRRPDHWPKRVTIVAPPKPLGTFLSATINFDQGRAQELMRAGYETGQTVASRIVARQ